MNMGSSSVAPFAVISAHRDVKSQPLFFASFIFRLQTSMEREIFVVHYPFNDATYLWFIHSHPQQWQFYLPKSRIHISIHFSD